MEQRFGQISKDISNINTLIKDTRAETREDFCKRDKKLSALEKVAAVLENDFGHLKESCEHNKDSIKNLREEFVVQVGQKSKELDDKIEAQKKDVTEKFKADAENRKEEKDAGKVNVALLIALASAISGLLSLVIGFFVGRGLG